MPESAKNSDWLFTVIKLTQTVCVGVFPGAPDRERGGGAAEGQTPQHHHVDRGGGHVI